VLQKENLAKHYWKQWRFLPKYFDEGVKNRAVHLGFRWKPPSSLGLAIDPKLTKCCGPRQGFLKIWPCCLQRHLERMQLFYLNTEMIVKQSFSVLKRV